MGEVIRLYLLVHRPLIAAAIKRLLETEKGFNIEVYAKSDCSRPCSQECMQPQPDVLVMDPNMHDVCGLDCIRRIRANHPEAKILVLSSQDDEISIGQARKAGAAGFISKYAPPSLLFQAIHHVTAGGTFFDGRHGIRKAAAGNVDSPLDQLTHREFEILTLMLEGLGSQEISNTLFISRSTVANHHTHILKKLGVSNMVELSKLALKQGLI